jgi:hypothetical protein
LASDGHTEAYETRAKPLCHTWTVAVHCSDKPAVRDYAANAQRLGSRGGPPAATSQHQIAGAEAHHANPSIGLSQERVGDSVAIVAAASPMTPPARRSILIADPDALVRDVISEDFVRRGWRVTTAVNGADALEAVRREPFDVIISDVNMPRGLWLWQRAIALRPELEGRFVLTSAEPLPGPRSMWRVIRSEHAHVKPVPLETIWADVQEILRNTDGHRPAP